MKHIKIYEELGYINDGAEKYEWYGESMLDYFFKNYDNIAHSELFADDTCVTLIIQFFTMDLCPEYLYKIGEFITFVGKYGKYNFEVDEGTGNINGHTLNLESRFFINNSEELEKELIKLNGLKFHPDIKKYNI